MATAILRPNADVLQEWALQGGATSGFDALDDGVTQPDAPGGGYLRTDVAATVEVHVGTVTVASVSEAKLWGYFGGKDALASDTTYKLFTGAVEKATVSTSGTAAGWFSATFTGSLTQAEVDDLRIKGIYGGGVGGQFTYFSEAYVELTYTAGLTGAVGQTAETDLAQPVTGLKTLAVGQPAEVEVAQPVTGLKTLVLGQVQETDSALTLVTAPAPAAVAAASDTPMGFIGFDPVSEPSRRPRRREDVAVVASAAVRTGEQDDEEALLLALFAMKEKRARAARPAPGKYALVPVSDDEDDDEAFRVVIH